MNGEPMLRLEFFELIGGAGATQLLGSFLPEAESEDISIPDEPLSGIVAIGVSPHPPRHVQYVSVFIDGGLLAADATAPYAFAWDTRAYKDGQHVLRADAVYRNHTHSESMTVTVFNAVAIYPSTSLYPSDTLPL